MNNNCLSTCKNKIKIEYLYGKETSTNMHTKQTRTSYMQCRNIMHKLRPKDKGWKDQLFYETDAFLATRRLIF